MDMIQPYGNHAPLILAGSCDGADWARTEKPAYGRPIGERFLERDYGAIAWVGPTIGTWQAPNMTVLSYFMEEVWNNLDRSLAESFMIAEQRIRTDYPDSEDVLQVLDSYIFLGDPLTRLNHLRVPTPVEDEQAPRKLALQNNYPNPFNPTTAINFAVHKRSHVKLTIHDLSGRLIDTLVDEIRAPGDYVVEWHGSDHRDRRAASGVYFYSLICNGQKLTKKMTLLK